MWIYMHLGNQSRFIAFVTRFRWCYSEWHIWYKVNTLGHIYQIYTFSILEKTRAAPSTFSHSLLKYSVGFIWSKNYLVRFSTVSFRWQCRVVSSLFMVTTNETGSKAWVCFSARMYVCVCDIKWKKKHRSTILSWNTNFATQFI